MTDLELIVAGALDDMLTVQFPDRDHRWLSPAEIAQYDQLLAARPWAVPPVIVGETLETVFRNLCGVQHRPSNRLCYVVGAWLLTHGSTRPDLPGDIVSPPAKTLVSRVLDALRARKR